MTFASRGLQGTQPYSGIKLRPPDVATACDVKSLPQENQKKSWLQLHVLPRFSVSTLLVFSCLLPLGLSCLKASLLFFCALNQTWEDFFSTKNTDFDACETQVVIYIGMEEIFLKYLITRKKYFGKI